MPNWIQELKNRISKVERDAKKHWIVTLIIASISLAVAIAALVIAILVLL
ncbi:hypothetical protein ES703_28306 [subsurface metagenome]